MVSCQEMLMAVTNSVVRVARWQGRRHPPLSNLLAEKPMQTCRCLHGPNDNKFAPAFKSQHFRRQKGASEAEGDRCVRGGRRRRRCALACSIPALAFTILIYGRVCTGIRYVRYKSTPMKPVKHHRNKHTVDPQCAESSLNGFLDVGNEAHLRGQKTEG